MTYRTGILVLVLSLANTALAAPAPSTPNTVNDIFFGFADGNLAGLIPALVLVALITFLAGVLKYVKAGDNEEQRLAGRQVMIFGIIVLFIMMSYWGFVDILTRSFFGETLGLPNYLPL